jgi:Flp pilus assembly protein TadB
MTVLQLIACIGIIMGCFMLLKLKPIEFTDAVFKAFTNRPKSIRDEIVEATGRKKSSFLYMKIMEAQDILALTGRSDRFSMVCLNSLLLFAIGACIAILMQNVFLIPVLAVGMMLLPFWYVKLTATHYKKDVAAELETALSITTTAYLRNEDILMAVEENIRYLNPPVQTVFKDFLLQLRIVNPDVEVALKDMKAKIDNDVFREWCDALADCQFDRSLKTTLTPIICKLSDMRIVNGELENLVFEPRKEFVMMAILVAGNVPLIYFLNKSWYQTLMHTPVGQIMLALTAAVIFISTAFMIKLTKPIEYRR